MVCMSATTCWFVSSKGRRKLTYLFGLAVSAKQEPFRTPYTSYTQTRVVENTQSRDLFTLVSWISDRKETAPEAEAFWFQQHGGTDSEESVWTGVSHLRGGTPRTTGCRALHLYHLAIESWFHCGVELKVTFSSLGLVKGFPIYFSWNQRAMLPPVPSLVGFRRWIAILFAFSHTKLRALFQTLGFLQLLIHLSRWSQNACPKVFISWQQNVVNLWIRMYIKEQNGHKSNLWYLQGVSVSPSLLAASPESATRQSSSGYIDGYVMDFKSSGATRTRYADASSPLQDKIGRKKAGAAVWLFCAPKVSRDKTENATPTF